MTIWQRKWRRKRGYGEHRLTLAHGVLDPCHYRPHIAKRGTAGLQCGINFGIWTVCPRRGAEICPSSRGIRYVGPPPQNANVQIELMKVSTLTFYKFVKNFESRVFFISAPGRRALKRWCLKGRSSSHFRAEHRKPLQIMPRKFARHTSEGYTWTN